MLSKCYLIKEVFHFAEREKHFLSFKASFVMWPSKVHFTLLEHLGRQLLMLPDNSGCARVYGTFSVQPPNSTCNKLY